MEDLFIIPEDPNAKIWRYMDFTKYVSMLIKSSLFFVRSDKFDDKFEGAPTKKDIDSRNEIQDISQTSEVDRKILPIYNQSQKKSIGICSWHLSEYESAAMWKLYLQSNEGVVIQSTFKKLDDSCKSFSELQIHTGLVKYTDYETEQIFQPSIFSRFMNKRKNFDHEKEVRSIFFIQPKYDIDREISEYSEEEIDILCETITGNGKYIKVNINDLIEKVVVSPYSKDWYFELVEEITKKLGFKLPLSYSTLSENPCF